MGSSKSKIVGSVLAELKAKYTHTHHWIGYREALALGTAPRPDAIKYGGSWPSEVVGSRVFGFSTREDLARFRSEWRL